MPAQSCNNTRRVEHSRWYATIGMPWRLAWTQNRRWIWVGSIGGHWRNISDVKQCPQPHHCLCTALQDSICWRPKERNSMDQGGEVGEWSCYIDSTGPAPSSPIFTTIDHQYSIGADSKQCNWQPITCHIDAKATCSCEMWSVSCNRA